MTETHQMIQDLITICRRLADRLDTLEAKVHLLEDPCDTPRKEAP